MIPICAAAHSPSARQGYLDSPSVLHSCVQDHQPGDLPRCLKEMGLSRRQR